jgi:Ca2+-binding RTX toxin-like protein
MRLLLTSLAVLCIAAPPVRAATVTATARFDDGYKGSGDEQLNLDITAPPGERNVLTVSVTGSTITVTDAGAPLTAGDGCRADLDGSVSCTSPRAGAATAVQARIATDDGDDAVTASGVAQVSIDGGSGNDALSVTGHGSAVLSGGLGDDVLSGGDGPDSLDGGPGADSMSGGAGADGVSYANRSVGVTAAIGTAGNGEPSEDDTIGADVEGLFGGSGPDVLTGSDAPNTLVGGAGDDRLTGLGGNDELAGGTGLGPPSPADDATADILSGGDGDDRLSTGPGGSVDAGPGADTIAIHGAARVSGGPGRDALTAYGPRGGATLAFADDGERDTLRCSAAAPPRSETLDALDVPLGCGPAPHRSGAGRLTLFSVDLLENEDLGLTMACPDDARRCRTAITVRAGSTIIARGRKTFAPGFHRRTFVKTTRAWKHLAIARGTTITATVTARDRAGRLRTSRADGCITLDGIGLLTAGRCP